MSENTISATPNGKHKLPKNEHDGNSWVIEHQNQETLELEGSKIGDSIYIGDCNEISVIVPSKVDKIIFDDCKNITLKCKSPCSKISVINCKDLVLTMSGKAASISIDKCRFVNIYLSKEALQKKHTEIFTSNSFEITVYVPNDLPDDKPIKYYENFQVNPIFSKWYGINTIESFEKAMRATKNGVLSKCKKNKHRKLFIIPKNYDGIYFNELNHENVLNMIEHFKNKRINIHFRTTATIILEAYNTFKDLPNVVNIDISAYSHFTLCGDIHGNLENLLAIFKKNGFPSATNGYLFNGDFVDHGYQSCEVILILFAFRALYPNSFFLARGNHESDLTNSMRMGDEFYSELSDKKFDESFRYLFCNVFCYLPLAHIINERIFVVHGGIYIQDEEAPSIEDLNRLPRRCQPSNVKFIEDLLWSDPSEYHDFVPNSLRGAGHYFGPLVSKKFLEKNHLDMIIRSHELPPNGYSTCHDGKVITITSVTYCFGLHINGAFINFTNELKPIFDHFK